MKIKKIKINKMKINESKKISKNNVKKRKIDPCPICGQHMDLCVTSHKNKPYVDNKLYNKICFTCYSVPKVMVQKYDKNGYITEEIPLEYSIRNLKNARELLDEGSAISLAEAKKCIECIKNLKINKEIKNKIKPKMEMIINEI